MKECIASGCNKEIPSGHWCSTKCKQDFHSENYYEHNPIKGAEKEIAIMETRKEMKESGLNYVEMILSKSTGGKENDNHTRPIRGSGTRPEQRINVSKENKESANPKLNPTGSLAR